MTGNLWMEIRSEKKKGLSYAEIGRKHHIDALLEEDNYSAALVLERIRERGCQCGYTIVKDFVSQKKKDLSQYDSLIGGGFVVFSMKKRRTY